MKKVIEKIKRYDIIKKVDKEGDEKRKRSIKTLKSYLLITLGTLICALGINIFFVPVSIVAGGVSGIAIIVHSVFNIPIGLFMLLINIPLFILGVKCIGKSFGAKTLFGTLALSLFIDLTQGIIKITDNLILCALFGGAISGLGLGVLFLSGATSGGTDILAKLGNKFFSFLDVGKWLFVIDFVIIAAGGVVFKNYELSLYGVIALFVNAYMIDFILAGADFAKVVYIISPKAEEIAQKVIVRLKRGVTGIYSKGIYTGKDTLMIMCIVKRYEVARLKMLAREIDPNSFIILTQAREVAGEGFKKYPEN